MASVSMEHGTCYLCVGPVWHPSRGNNACKGPEAFEPGEFFRLLEEACEGPGQALDGEIGTCTDLSAAPTIHPALGQQSPGVPPTLGGWCYQYTHCEEAER